MNQWTPEQWGIFFGFLTTFIVTLGGVIVSIVKAFHADSKASANVSRTDAIEKRIDAQASVIQQTQNQLFQVAKDAAPPPTVSVTPVTIEQPDKEKI